MVEAGEAARTLFAPAGSTMVIVGDSRKFLEALRKTHPDVTVIPFKDLRIEDLPSR